MNKIILEIDQTSYLLLCLLLLLLQGLFINIPPQQRVFPFLPLNPSRCVIRTSYRHFLPPARRLWQF